MTPFASARKVQNSGNLLNWSCLKTHDLKLRVSSGLVIMIFIVITIFRQNSEVFSLYKDVMAKQTLWPSSVFELGVG